LRKGGKVPSVQETLLNQGHRQLVRILRVPTSCSPHDGESNVNPSQTPERRLLDMTEIQGLPAGVGAFKGKAPAVRRYDRLAEGISVHQEDFAQVLAGVDAGLEFVRRLTMNSIIGNGDMHVRALMPPLAAA
jgi:hypothetical protein